MIWWYLLGALRSIGCAIAIRIVLRDYRATRLVLSNCKARSIDTLWSIDREDSTVKNTLENDRSAGSIILESRTLVDRCRLRRPINPSQWLFHMSTWQRDGVFELFDSLRPAIDSFKSLLKKYKIISNRSASTNVAFFFLFFFCHRRPCRSKLDWLHCFDARNAPTPKPMRPVRLTQFQLSLALL